MAIIKCLLTIALLLVTNQSLSLQDDETVNNKVKEIMYRLSEDIVPIHYDVKLILHKMHIDNIDFFEGNVSIDLKVSKPTYTIALHMSQILIGRIAKLTVKKNESFSGPVYFNTYSAYNYESQILTIGFEDQLHPAYGNYKLYLECWGPQENTNGFSKFSYINTKTHHKTWLAITPRDVFPCWDDPAIKASFQFSIKHSPDYIALSNTTSTRSEVDALDGKLWTYFETTPIMSINELGFIIADYDYITNKDGIIKLWNLKHLVDTHYMKITKRSKRESFEKFINSTKTRPRYHNIHTYIFGRRRPIFMPPIFRKVG